MDIKKSLNWFGRFTILLLLYYALFISGTLTISGLLPDIKSEPGPISNDIDFLILGFSNTLLIIGLILREWRTARKQLIKMPEGYMRLWENRYIK